MWHGIAFKHNISNLYRFNVTVNNNGLYDGVLSSTVVLLIGKIITPLIYGPIYTLIIITDNLNNVIDNADFEYIRVLSITKLLSTL